MVRRVMMIAGEASGDLHGAGVVRELKRRFPDVDVYGVGGDGMRGAGMETLYHVSQLAFMGFAEVLGHLGFLRKVERTLERSLDLRPPDVVVLIDYPGFNLRFARKARRRGLRVLYYIGPQIWAWRSGRVRKMRAAVDSVKVVFPFEEEMYRRAGMDVEFVGHPLVESIGEQPSREAFLASQHLRPGTKLLALLPGSRKQEIRAVLPVMAGAAERLRKELGLQVALGLAPTLDSAAVRTVLPPGAEVRLVEGGTRALMRHADAAIVTSGTATLETAWFGTPMVVVYRTSPLTYLLGRLLVRLKNIGLVNIVAGERIVPELIQGRMTEENIVRALRPMLADPRTAASVRERLGIIRGRLGTPGAAARVVDGIERLAGAA
ncbi:MAG: lipid-A-disaccharide synthase [Bacteroidota bacterium]